jgi:5-methylthioadenosine/S-adenosylhomocysteine deaminase
VEHVWVAGRQVVASGRPTQVDLEQILADAQRAADALWRRARGG